MLSRRLLVTCVALLALFAYLYFGENKLAFAIPAGITITAGIFIWIFQHQINWLWYGIYPPTLPAPVSDLYAVHQPFFRNLDKTESAEFGRRCALFVQHKEWIIMGKDEVPEDLKYMVAFYAVQVGWYRGEYLFEGYDRVVFYLHPFLSPHYKEQVHTYEVEHIDGTLIFSVDNLSTGFIDPGKYYQVGLHALAEVFHTKFDGDYPGPDVWPAIEASSPVLKAELEGQTGLNQDDPWPALVHNWFTFSNTFQGAAGELYERVGRILGVDSGQIEVRSAT